MVVQRKQHKEQEHLESADVKLNVKQAKINRSTKRCRKSCVLKQRRSGVTGRCRKSCAVGKRRSRDVENLSRGLLFFNISY